MKTASSRAVPIAPSPGRRAWLACGLGTLAGAVFAATGPTAIRYGGDAAFPPFEYLDEQGVPRGFQVDLAAELGRVLGAEVVVTLKPWAQTEADFRAGRVDTIAMVDTAARRQWARFTTAHATPAFGIYRLRTRPEPQGPHDLAGLRIAVRDTDTMRETIDTLLSGLQATYVPFTEASRALAAVQRGEADIALLPRAYADRHLGTAIAPDIVAGSTALRLQSYAFAVAPHDEALQGRLQRALGELERSGRLEALRVKWLSSHHEVAERQRLEQEVARKQQWSWGVGGASAAALLAIGGVAWVHGRRYVVERKRRRDAEALLARVFTANPEPMLIVERASGAVRDANAAVLRLLGLPADEAADRPLRTLAEHVAENTLARLAAALDRQGSLDAVPLRLPRADGSERACLVSAEPLTIDGVEHVFCIVHDVTDQLVHDAALREGYDTLVAQLESSQQALATARDEKARAEGELQAFTRAVAHDLRAPLNAVQGFAGLLRERLRAGRIDEAIGYGEHIERAARRMNEMIGTLASLARVTREPLARQAVDMTRIAQDTWTLLASSHPQRHVECRIDPLPEAQADPAQAAQVWQNLLDNAYKYTAKVAEAKVAVDSYRDERGIWYRVTDNGAGFDMAHARSLFLPFQRMHTDAQFPGTGVGLSLVRRIVDRHGGDIRLRSTPGVGTVVEFTLAPAAVA